MFNDDLSEDNINDADDIEIVDLPSSSSSVDQRVQHMRRVQTMGKRLWTGLRQPCLFSFPTVFACLLLLTLLSGSQLYQQVEQHSTTVYAGAIYMGGLQGGGTPGKIKSGNVWSYNGTNFVVNTGTLPPGCATATAIGTAPDVGAYPVWIKGFTGPNAHFSLQASDVTGSPQMGWDVPVEVSVIYNFPGPVTLSFGTFPGDVSALPPVFVDDAQSIYATTKTLNPDSAMPRSAPADKHLNVWKLNIHISAPGCYTLDVDWDSGHWHLNFIAQ